MINLLIIVWLCVAANLFGDSTYKWYYRRKRFNKMRSIAENIIEALLWPVIVIINILTLMKKKYFN